MILLKSKEKPLPYYNGGLYRSTFQIWKFGFGFISQYKFPNSTWTNSHTAVYQVSVTTNYFKIGSYHTYYDGPHCFYSLGFIHFQLGGNWNCKHCCPRKK